MLEFDTFYFAEKTIRFKDFEISRDKHPADQKCVNAGQKLAKRFGLEFNGWWEMTFTFTIPEGVPNEKNTLMAKNESELIDKLKKRFPEYLKYIMKKNFPNGYKPDITIPNKPPKECEPIDLDAMIQGKE